MVAHSHHRQRLRSDADHDLRTWVSTCLERLDPALALIASGSMDPEAVHQARVALRRIRVAFSLVEGCPHTAPIQTQDPLVALFRGLGTHRDNDMQQSLLSGMLGQLWSDWAMTQIAATPKAHPTDRQTLVRDTRHRMALNALRAWAALPQSQTASRGKPWRQHLQKRLQQWHRRVQSDALGFDKMEVEAVHRLRKRLKRLRYALNFLYQQHARPDVKAYLRQLAPLQEALGDFNDAHTAMHHCARWRPSANQATCLAWLDFQQAQARARAKTLLDCLDTDLPSLW